ncbi:hypothetical protein EJB05_01943, partial [Eragrostis curvula]
MAASSSPPAAPGRRAPVSGAAAASASSRKHSPVCCRRTPGWVPRAVLAGSSAVPAPPRRVLLSPALLQQIGSQGLHGREQVCFELLGLGVEIYGVLCADE